MTENAELLIKKAQNGDIEAKSQLIQENSGLIWSVVRKFSGRGNDAEDLFQIGAIGLIKSINKFDFSYNVEFSTYAVPMIIGEIKRFLRDDNIIKVSRAVKSLAFKARLLSQAYYAKNGVVPTIKEMSEELDVSEEELIIAMESLADVESLYKTITNNESGKESFLIDEFNGYGRDEEELIILRSAVNSLNNEERTIIRMRYFDDRTQSEIGNMLNMSQVQVSRLEKKILCKIKEKLV